MLKLVNKQPLTSITLDAEVFTVMPMIGHAAFSVYCLLIFLSNTDDEFPPLEYIGEVTGMSVESVEKSISVLIEENLVDVKTTRGSQTFEIVPIEYKKYIFSIKSLN